MGVSPKEVNLAVINMTDGVEAAVLKWNTFTAHDRKNGHIKKRPAFCEGTHETKFEGAADERTSRSRIATFGDC